MLKLLSVLFGLDSCQRLQSVLFTKSPGKKLTARPRAMLELLQFGTMRVDFSRIIGHASGSAAPFMHPNTGTWPCDVSAAPTFVPMASRCCGTEAHFAMSKSSGRVLRWVMVFVVVCRAGNSVRQLPSISARPIHVSNSASFEVNTSLVEMTRIS